MKKILITGKGSYIGEQARNYLMQTPEKYQVDIKETIGWKPTPSDFYDYDVVFNVAGIAHIKETEENRQFYYEINRDLAVDIARAAKTAGVRQLILLSSMSVYGVIEGCISKNTRPKPVSAYGDSKLQADLEIKKLEDDSFVFACLRPPMVYGRGCKGNYQRLRKLAIKSPIFPNYYNERSMIYIGNLCEFVKSLIDSNKGGLFFPQNAEYINTCKMVKCIAECHGKKVRLTKAFNWLLEKSNSNVIRKVFGNLVYEPIDMIKKYSFEESVKLSEGLDL